MQTLLYLFARVVIALLQSLPLPVVALLGRWGGALAWYLDKPHREVVLKNLQQCFPEKTSAETRTIGRENFRRIGENYASAVKTASMPVERILEICEVKGLEKFPEFGVDGSPRNCIVAIGHFGNFELNATLGRVVKGIKPATTYRGLRQPKLNSLLQGLREQSGCRFFERRTDAKALQAALNEGGLLLGLLSDQHAGKGGVITPFFGRPASTTGAPAVLSLRYQAALYTAVCYRVRLGHWRVEVGDEIETHKNGSPRSPEEITVDINRAFEEAIRRDPANWFWVHKRWKVRE